MTKSATTSPTLSISSLFYNEVVVSNQSVGVSPATILFMNKDSEITSFSPTSPAAKQVASTLILLGTIGFWSQLIFGTLSLVMLFFGAAILGSGGDPSGNENLALFCAALGVLTLILSVFFFFRRYISIGKALKKSRSGSDRPNKKFTLRLIRLGLTSNLIGMLISILGAEAFAGILLRKASRIPSVTNTLLDATQLINPAEMTALLANIHTIFCHFAGITLGLILLERINR